LQDSLSIANCTSFWLLDCMTCLPIDSPIIAGGETGGLTDGAKR